MEPPDVTVADLLVVGSGTYIGNPREHLLNFLKGLTPVTGKYVACFATCGGRPQHTLTAMEEILKAKGYSIIHRFSCYGHLDFLKIGHLAMEEFSKAQEFARQLNDFKSEGFIALKRLWRIGSPHG